MVGQKKQFPTSHKISVMKVLLLFYGIIFEKKNNNVAIFPFLPSCWWLFGYVDPNDTDSLSNLVFYTKLKTRARQVWAQPMLRRRWRNAQCSVPFNFVRKRYFSSLGCSLCGKALKPKIHTWYSAVSGLLHIGIYAQSCFSDSILHFKLDSTNGHTPNDKIHMKLSSNCFKKR